MNRYLSTVGQVTQQHGRRVLAADLRYPSAYAVRLRGITTGEVPKPVARPLVKPVSQPKRTNAPTAR